MGNLYDPGPGRVKLARFRLQRGGKLHKITTGSVSKTAALRFLSRIEILVERRQQGDPPPIELADWIVALPDATAAKLSELGLIDRRARTARQPLLDPPGEGREPGQITQWQHAVAARRGNTAEHAQRYAACVRRVAQWLNWHSYDEGVDGPSDDPPVTASKIEVELEKRGLAPATRSKYLLAVEDFCRWMVQEKRARVRLVRDVSKPKPVPAWDRRPFEPSEIAQLFAFLDQLDRYPHQAESSRWSGRDRRLIYWTAIKTAYRKNELASLRRYQLQLDSSPAYIDIAARDAKNRTKSAVPIPADLAEALRRHVEQAQLGPADRVFWISDGKDRTRISKRTGQPYRIYGGAAGMLRRDLKEAGLGDLLDAGQQVDFHCLRATAITWWLEQDRLSPLRVKQLARLSSLDMVMRYVRGARFQDTAWLESSSLPKSDDTAEPPAGPRLADAS